MIQKRLCGFGDLYALLLTKKGVLTKECWCREYLSLQQSTMAWYFLQGIASIQSQTNLTAFDFLLLFTGKRLANFNLCFSQLCSLLRQVAFKYMRSSEYFFMHFNLFSHLICGNKQNSFLIYFAPDDPSLYSSYSRISLTSMCPSQMSVLQRVY